MEVIQATSKLVEYKHFTKIADGSSGTVYAVEEIETNLQHAVKIMPLLTEEHKKRYKAELKIHKKLRHRNICHLKQSKQIRCRGMQYGIIVLDKMETDLQNYVAQQRITEAEIKVIFRKVCKAVKYLHSKGVAHLDIKAENVLLSFDGEKRNLNVKLCDFGYSKRWDLSKNITSAYMLSSNELFGTIDYLPPELISYSNHSKVIYLQKVDVYALGVLLYSLTTNTYPNEFNDDGSLRASANLRKALRSSTNGCSSLVLRMMQETDYLRPTIDEILDHPWLRRTKKDD